MTIVVEFFGIPRARAGIGHANVCDGLEEARLDEVIAEVAQRFPEFARTCTTDGHMLSDGYIASIDGVRFVQAAHNQIVHSGQSVLILSADAGG